MYTIGYSSELRAEVERIASIDTIDTEGPPRLVHVEQPETNYFKDEGGKSRVLVFGFELHGDISKELRDLEDSQNCVPLDCKLMFEDGREVGAENWGVKSGFDRQNSHRSVPMLNLSTRQGGVRFDISQVSKKTKKKYVLQVSVAGFSGMGGGVLKGKLGTSFPVKPIRSEPITVFSKRVGARKDERKDDETRRLKRILDRKQFLRQALRNKSFRDHKPALGGNHAFAPLSPFSNNSGFTNGTTTPPNNGSDSPERNNNNNTRPPQHQQHHGTNNFFKPNPNDPSVRMLPTHEIKSVSPAHASSTSLGFSKKRQRSNSLSATTTPEYSALRTRIEHLERDQEVLHGVIRTLTARVDLLEKRTRVSDALDYVNTDEPGMGLGILTRSASINSTFLRRSISNDSTIEDILSPLNNYKRQDSGDSMRLCD